VAKVVFDYQIGGPVLARVTGGALTEPILDWLRDGSPVLHESSPGEWVLVCRNPAGHLQVRTFEAREESDAVEWARGTLSDLNAAPGAAARASGAGTGRRGSSAQ
jgi:hypothetical protein